MPTRPQEFYELDDSKDPLIDHENFGNESESLDDGSKDSLSHQEVPYQDEPSKEVLFPENGIFQSNKSREREAGTWKRYLARGRSCWIIILLLTVVLLLFLSSGRFLVHEIAVSRHGESEPWYPTPRGGTTSTWKDAYKKAADLVEQMTLVEKVNITTGIGWSMGMCVGNTGPVDRLGFPSLCLQDGPLGLRFLDDATAWPAGITVGATWNKALMFQRGKAHGFEAKKKGINVLLGPSVGPIGRLPAGGRNWEGFGSDPVLQGIAAAETIKGIQSEGVMATVKHYVGNEQEHFRQAWEWGTPDAISSNIGDRALHEIYAWPFAESIKAEVASVMCSYNQVNNSYACQNSKLLNGVLKDELGFQGFVMSDWLGQRSGVASALAGLDMTMPGDGLQWQDGKSLWGSELTKAVLNTSVPLGRLNDMTMRIVAAWYKAGQDVSSQWPSLSEGGGPNFSSWTNDDIGNLHPGSPGSNEKGSVNKHVPVRNTEEGGDHDALARKIAAEGIVLVKNQGDILPLPRDAQGWRPKFGLGKVKVGIFGEDAVSNPNGVNSCVDRSCNEGTLTMGWGSGAVELPYLVSPLAALSANLDETKYLVESWPDNYEPEVENRAHEQEICFVFINSDAGEGFLSWGDVKGDRNDLYAQKGGDELVRKVASNCENTVVVLHTVGPTILERWIDVPGVKAALVAHLPGQESGNALADVVFGDVNPSGRLPYTIAKAEEDYGPTSKILYSQEEVVPQQDFSEGLYIDYRYFDKYNMAPRYEFGYGLSYTKFELHDLIIHSLGMSGSEPRLRPDGLDPPTLDDAMPSAESAVWPNGMRKLRKYIYPYIDSVSEIRKAHYDYPPGYHTEQPLSKAGGGEGGNPDLYEIAIHVEAMLTNLGPLEGECVVQLYLEYPKDVRDEDNEIVDMPVKVLRNFDKIWVAGSPSKEKTKEISMDLTRKDLSYWDVKRQNWIVPTGEFKIHMGFSSRDLPISSTFVP